MVRVSVHICVSKDVHVDGLSILHLLDATTTSRYFSDAEVTLWDVVFALWTYRPGTFGVIDKKGGGHCEDR